MFFLTTPKGYILSTSAFSLLLLLAFISLLLTVGRLMPLLGFLLFLIQFKSSIVLIYLKVLYELYVNRLQKSPTI